MKILLIDDDEVILKAMANMLSKEGYEVKTTVDGTEVVDLIADEEYDLIITDIMMPYISGIELLTTIKSDPKRKTPVLVVSALDQKEVILTAFELGAADFVKKPISLDELLIRVKKVFSEV